MFPTWHHLLLASVSAKAIIIAPPTGAVPINITPHTIYIVG